MAQIASNWVMGVGAGSCVNGTDDLRALVLGFADSDFSCPAGEQAYLWGNAIRQGNLPFTAEPGCA